MDKKYRYHFLAVMGYNPPENQSLETISGKGRQRDKDEEEMDDTKDGEIVTLHHFLRFLLVRV